MRDGNIGEYIDLGKLSWTDSILKNQLELWTIGTINFCNTDSMARPEYMERYPSSLLRGNQVFATVEYSL